LVDPVDITKRSPIPSFMTNLTPGTQTLLFNTNNEADCGTYRIAVKGSQSGFTAESFFSLIVILLDCKSETVSPDGTLGPIDYDIGSGVVNLKPTWTSSVSRFTCPAKFEIFML
jgi:hypothetical protein